MPYFNYILVPFVALSSVFIFQGKMIPETSDVHLFSEWVLTEFYIYFHVYISSVSEHI